MEFSHMTNKLLSALLAGTFLAGAATLSAQAADLPAQSYYKAPVAAPMAYNWTGLYLGVMGGYMAGSGDLDGGFFGGTVGYNWQAAGSPWVIGIEFDGGWTNFGASETVGPLFAETEANSVFTLRGRLGHTFLSDRTLLYVTGGGAWMRNEITLGAVGGPFISESKTHSGWTVGAGIEHAVTENVSLKVEYQYMDLGSKTYFGAFDSGDVDSHSVKFGANFHFKTF